MTQHVSEGQNFAWLIDDFVQQLPSVTHAIVVSIDGLCLAASSSLELPVADRLAAAVSGLTSLMTGAVRCVGYQQVIRQVIEAEEGFFFVLGIGPQAVLGVAAARDCDLGQVGYEMSLFVDRAGQALTPTAIAQLKNSLSAQK